MSQIDDFLLLTEFDGKTFPTKFVERGDLLKIGAVGKWFFSFNKKLAG